MQLLTHLFRNEGTGEVARCAQVEGTWTNDRFGVNYPRLVSRAELDLTQAGRGAGERIEARPAEKPFPGRARERRAEKAVNAQECIKSSLRITHITSPLSVARSVSLMGPLYPACIPSHCTSITRDMNHPKDRGSSRLSRSIDPPKRFIKRRRPNARCKARNNSRIIARRWNTILNVDSSRGTSCWWNLKIKLCYITRLNGISQIKTDYTAYQLLFSFTSRRRRLMRLKHRRTIETCKSRRVK